MNGKIKIGYSEDPISRMKQLQTSSPRELTMMVFVKGDREYENKLHKRFQPSRDNFI